MTKQCGKIAFSVVPIIIFLFFSCYLIHALPILFLVVNRSFSSVYYLTHPPISTVFFSAQSSSLLQAALCITTSNAIHFAMFCNGHQKANEDNFFFFSKKKEDSVRHFSKESVCSSSYKVTDTGWLGNCSRSIT